MIASVTHVWAQIDPEALASDATTIIFVWVWCGAVAALILYAVGKRPPRPWEWVLPILFGPIELAYLLVRLLSEVFRRRLK